MNAQLLDSLAWTLLHFIWQGALIGAGVALGLAVLRNARAQARYACAALGMLLCLLWPVWTFWQQIHAPMSLEVAWSSLASARQVEWVEQAAWQTWLDRQVRPYLPALIMLWGLGVAMMLTRLGLGLAWLARLRNTAHVAGLDSTSWQRQTDRLRGRMGITRQVEFRFIAGLSSPLTLGALRPLILMPAHLATGMPYAQLEALLAHELGHIRHWDYVANLLQNLLQAVLFYHPVVWWLAQRLEFERELMADSAAGQVLAQPSQLAYALQGLASPMQQNLALSAQGGDLLARIRRLVQPAQQPWRWSMAAPAVLLMCLGMTALPQVSALNTATPQSGAQAESVQTQAAKMRVAITAEHAIVIDETSGQVLYEKNADVVSPIASLSKLMIAMLIIDAKLDLNEKIKVTPADMAKGRTPHCKLAAGMVLTRGKLLELALIPSSNNATFALARTYPGGAAAIVKAAQAKLAALGMQHSEFHEASGMSNKNVASARDLLRLVEAAKAYPELQAMSSQASGEYAFAGGTERFFNTNRLMKQAGWEIVLSKTGYSEAAGGCLVMRVLIAGKPTTFVLLKAQDVFKRFDDAAALRTALQPTL